MTKRAKIWLGAGAGLTVLGLILFALAMNGSRWDFKKLGTVQYETNTHEISESFRNISVETDTADILFVPSAEGRCKVVCYEAADEKHAVSVQGDTLAVAAQPEKPWYGHIGIVTDFPKITLYLPEREYEALVIDESTGDIRIPEDFSFESVDIAASTGDVEVHASASGLMKIGTSTGDITVKGVSAGALELSVSTGEINAESVTCPGDVTLRVSTGKAELTDVACESFTSAGSTGDLTMENVTAKKAFSIERSTGDVRFKACDAAEIFVKTDTGDVSGSLLTDKVFFTESDTGDIDVPRTSAGGRCEIITDTGDITLCMSAG